MTTGDRLIILHTTKFSETSIVVHTLSREYGRRSFLVRKPRMSMFLPLNIVEAEIVESSKSKLYLARNFSSEFPLNGIRNNIYKNSITLFLSEMLFKTLKDGAREDKFFEWCESRILLLDALESDFSNFHLRFLLEMAVQLGFAPERRDLMPFVGEHCELVTQLLESQFPESMMVPMSGAVRNEIADLLVRYIEYHSESAININSLRVLRELFI